MKVTGIKNKYNKFSYFDYTYDINIIHPLVEYKRTQIIDQLSKYMDIVFKRYNYFLTEDLTNDTCRWFLAINASSNDPVLPIKDEYDLSFFYKITTCFGFVSNIN